MVKVLDISGVKLMLVITFVFIGLFFVFNFAKAATVYVSNSATNGYQIGNDANTYAQAQSKDTPWLTVTKAVSSAVSNGDTIVINDGTYNEASFVGPARSNLTINSENDYGAIIRNNLAAQTRVFHVGAAATGLILGKVVLDANNDDTYCMTFDSTNPVSSLTINGTKFLNPTSYFMTGSRVVNLTMSGSWVAESSQSGTGFSLSPNAAGNYNISNGTITQTGITAGSTYAWAQTPSVTGNNFNISNITISRTTSNGSSLSGIYSYGPSTVSIHDNSFSYSGATVVSAITVPNHPSITVTACSVYNNTGDLNGTDNYAIFVGNDSAPSVHTNIQNALIYGNNITGTNHGYALGYVTGGKIYNNYADSLVIGVLAKYTTSTQVYNNIINNPGAGGGLYAKGGTDTLFYNNTIIEGVDTTAGPLRVTENATDIVYKNNIVYSEQANSAFVTVAVGSDATFDRNIYYSTQGLSATAWIYQGTGYSTLALWQAAGHDANSLSSNPLFISSSNRNLQAASPAIDAAEDMNQSTDYVGESRYDMPSIANTGSAGSYTITYTDIGAYEYITPPDPTLTSTTHSSESTWYNSISPVTISFTSPYDNVGKAATTDFKYLINQTLAPGAAAVKAGTALDDAVTFDASGSILSDGTWYVHTIAQNEATTTVYSTNYDTFTVKYDATNPSVSISDLGSEANSTPTFNWSGSDATSGIAAYTLYIDGIQKYSGSDTSYTASYGISCGDHTWYVKATDNASNDSDSSTDSFTVFCGGGGHHPNFSSILTPPEFGFRVIINDGTKSANSSLINLKLFGGSDAKKMAISLTGDFKDAGQEDYKDTKQINLCPMTNCQDREYTVYVKFYNQYGKASDIVSAKINLVLAPKILPPEAKFSKDLKPGASDSQVKDLQKFLNQNGYKLADTGPGSPDNETDYFGPLTLRALTQFQKDNSLGERGYVGSNTRQFINSFASPPKEESDTGPLATFTTPLYLGLRSDDVARLQELLATKPEIYPEGLVTGYFGLLTLKAVQKFQLQYKIIDNQSDPGFGYVGPKTREKLQEIFKK